MRHLLHLLITLLFYASLPPQALGEKIPLGHPIVSTTPVRLIGGTGSWRGIAEDSRGHLYVATHNQIFSSTGERWEQLPSYNHGSVASMRFDRRDRLFITAAKDIGYLDVRAPAQPWISIKHQLPTTPSPYRWRLAYEDLRRDTLYFIRGNSVIAWHDGQTLRQWKATSNIRHVFHLADQPCAITDTGIILRLNDDDTTTTLRELGPTPNARFVRALLPLSPDQILLSCDDQNFWLLTPTTLAPWKLQGATLEARPRRCRLHRYDDQHLALITATGSVLLTQLDGHVVDQHRQLSPRTTQQTLLDHRGGLWITNSLGLHCLTLTPGHTFYGNPQGIEGTLHEINAHHGQLLVLTSTGTYRARPGETGPAFEPITGLGESCRLQSATTGPLIAGPAGLHLLDPQTLNPHTLLGGPCFNLLSSAATPSDTFYFSHNGTLGTARLRDQHWEIQSLPELPTTAPHHTFVADRDGTLWILSEKGTVNSYHPASGPKRYDSAHGLTPETEYDPYVLAGEPLLVGHGQVLRFDPINDHFYPDPACSVLSPEASAPITATGFAITDAKGRCWIAPSPGNHHLVPAPDPAHLRSLAWLGQGAASSAPEAIYSDEAGNIWYGSAYGLLRATSGRPISASLRPSAPSAASPVVSISAVFDLKNNTPLALAPFSTPLQIPYEKNSLRFRYSMPDFRSAGLNQYTVRLEGFQADATPYHLGDECDFTNLAPGDYVLHIEGKNFFDQAGQPAALAFTVLGPFYRTPLGLGLIGLSTIGLVAGVFCLRQRQLRTRNNELTRLVAERSAHLAEAVAQAHTLAREAEDASRAKGQFLANMSHEIRTPLNGVMGMAHLLSESPLSPSQKDYLRTIRSSSEALLAIVNDILDLTKVEAGKLPIEHIAYDLRASVEDILELLAPSAHQKKIELLGIIGPHLQLPRIGDPARLRQILVNLIGNAIKFTDHGQVILRINAPDPARPDLLSLVVTDTGIGIPSEKIPALFQPFYQVETTSSRRYGGTGLGLAISRQLAQLMGGDITLTSAPGQGSTFIATLVSPPNRESPAPEPSPEILREKNVLILEDQPAHRAYLEDLARRWSLRPLLTHSTEEADQTLAAHPTDLLWLNPHLTDTDALAWAHRHRQSHPQARIILLTSTQLSEPIRTFLTQPHTAFLTKPLRTAQLARLSAQLLDLQPPPPPPPAAPPIAPLSPAEKLRVLLVEDNPVNQKVAALLLKKNGIAPVLANNGLEAIAALQRQTYDLILMDLHMPECDGLEATRRIRAEFPPDQQPRIIALTAAALAADRKACIEAGMDDFTTKPIRPIDLQKIIQDTINLHSG